MGHGCAYQSPGYRTVADGRGKIQKFCAPITHLFPAAEIAERRSDKVSYLVKRAGTSEGEGDNGLNIDLSRADWTDMVLAQNLFPGSRKMGFNDDFIDPLVEEILTDVAGSFFGNRRRLDEKIDLFNGYVKALRRKEVEVRDSAALLNHLLLRGDQAPAFYEILNVEGTLLTAAGALVPQNTGLCMPFAIGFCTRFVKLVCNAYDALQKSCAVYLHGRPEADMTTTADSTHVYYDLVLEMHRLVNQEIKRVNASISPSCALQFAKRLNPQMVQKEQVTGGGASDARSLDDKLCYMPIDLQALSLTKYPELPEIGIVLPEIKRFCETLCRAYGGKIKEDMAELKYRLSTCKT